MLWNYTKVLAEASTSMSINILRIPKVPSAFSGICIISFFFLTPYYLDLINNYRRVPVYNINTKPPGKFLQQFLFLLYYTSLSVISPT